MIIDCISDLHGFFPSLDGGDLLILSGDYTASDKLTQWAEFFNWLAKQKYEKKILVAGNHDNFFESGFPKNQMEADELKEVIDFLDTGVDFEYLCDSGTEYKGLKIWGSPWTKTFEGMNQKCMAFTCDHEFQLKEKWDLIPDNTDILITHSPPYGIFDRVIETDYLAGSRTARLVGSRTLLDALERVMPKLHVFGHIHEHGGKQLMYKHQGPNTWCVNSSLVDENYKHVNQPIRIEL